MRRLVRLLVCSVATRSICSTTPSAASAALVPTGCAHVATTAAEQVGQSGGRARVSVEMLTSAMPTSGTSRAWIEDGGAGGHLGGR